MLREEVQETRGRSGTPLRVFQSVPGTGTGTFTGA